MGEGDLVKLPLEDCKVVSKIEAWCAKNNEGHAKLWSLLLLLEEKTGSRTPQRRFGNTFRESISEDDRSLYLYKLVLGKVL